MASVTCPNCGNDNPDFLDNCQFCQTALRREATLNIGENPTKKSTGELEPILPDWLKDARQQARDSAEEEAAKEATRPKIQKAEAPDLLAGLAFQSAANEEEVPDWLAAINPIKETKPAAPTKPAEEAPSDFFAQFNQPAQQEPVKPVVEESHDEAPAWMTGLTDKSPQTDELSGWLSQPTAQSDEPFNFTSTTPQESTPAAQEDLSWLHNLEASSKPVSSTPETPQADMGWMPPTSSGAQEDLGWLGNLGGMPLSNEPVASQPESAQEDLNWLNNLGGTPAPSQPAPADEGLGWLNNLDATPESTQPAPKQDDLSWLNNIGGEPVSAQPVPAQEDLSWLNNLGGTTEPAPASAQEDLNWLTNLGGEPPAQPVPAQEDMSWLSNLGGTPEATQPEPETFAQPEQADWSQSYNEQPPVVSMSPAHTAPLSADAAPEMPDWLKSATEAPSMPPLGAAASSDWLASKTQPMDDIPLKFDDATPIQPPSYATSQADIFASSQSEPAPVDQSFSPASTDSSISSHDVDSLFNVDMPDWLSQQPESTTEPSTPAGMTPAQTGGALSPVDLPSWVQAMRPVESVISETSASAADQTTEREGPLAGFRGVIPFAPIGSAQRPKAISLKLQATDEQQATAALIEQIIASESTAHPLKATSFIVSQRTLRWILSALFIIAISAMLWLNINFMPVFVSASQIAKIGNTSNVIIALPEGEPVLIVIDYEPSLSGEMEASAGPLLDQMAILRHLNFTFISSSPNGTALAERLMAKTKINQPVSAGGLGYEVNSQYFIAGYLPGGSAGVNGFIEAPQQVLPETQVTEFGEYAAVVVITDNAESGLTWVEQIELAKHSTMVPASQPLLMVASAQAGPMLEPYVSSQQVTGMISGMPDAARYEYMNNSRPGLARSYWDAFGAGLSLAIGAMILGSLWSLFAGIRARRMQAGQG